FARPTDLEFTFFLLFTGETHESSALAETYFADRGLWFVCASDVGRRRDAAGARSKASSGRGVYGEDEEVHDGAVFHFAAGELFAGIEERADARSGTGRRGWRAGNPAVRKRCVQVHALARKGQSAGESF